jgi:hypothetical protein
VESERDRLTRLSLTTVQEVCIDNIQQVREETVLVKNKQWLLVCFIILLFLSVGSSEVLKGCFFAC